VTRIVELRLAAHVERWRALGLDVIDGSAVVGGVRLCFVAPGEGCEGLVGWGLDPTPDGVDEVDGIAVWAAEPPTPGSPDEHLLRPVGIDHVVVSTDSIERTCGAIESLLGAPLKRVRDAGGGVRQGFHRLGEVIVEVVELPGADPGPAALWGLVLNVEDLHDAAGRLGPDVLTEPKAAVQPGRFIASCRAEAGLGTRVALMTPG
jgi:hypothetical protein